jgi:hypothetical protein
VKRRADSTTRTRAGGTVLPGGPRRLAVLGLALLAVAAPGRASAQIDLPEPVGYINDFADVIPADAEARIQRVIDEVRSKSGGEMVW